MTKKRDVTNTTSTMSNIENLVTAQVLGPNFIEHQERQGQQELTTSSQLPTKGLLEERAVFEKMGIKIGEVCKDDPIFTHVELPNGWKKIPTDHNMWSNLVDRRGDVRAAIFYKAAFYDRSAHINMKRRFSISKNYDRLDYRDVLEFQVKDRGKVVFKSATVAIPKRDGKELYSQSERIEKELQAECVAWLIENGFPNFSDPAEYWDNSLSRFEAIAEEIRE